MKLSFFFSSYFKKQIQAKFYFIVLLYILFLLYLTRYSHRFAVRALVKFGHIRIGKESKEPEPELDSC